jgi:cytochrome P450
MDPSFEFDLFDPQQTQHMWDLMAEMRRECPVAQPAEGFFYTARYDDTQRVFRDSRTFSCAGGFRAAGVEIPDEELLMAEMDPPLHPRIRKFALASFNPGMARRAEPFTRAYVNTCFDGLDAARGGDLVVQLSSPVPVAVTGHVLGVPMDDIPVLAERFFALLHTDWPAYGVKDREKPDEGVGIAGSAPELSAYFDDQIARRRSGLVPDDDLLAQLTTSEIDGEHLSDTRIRTLACNFLAAGLSTTNLVSNLMLRLLTSEDFHRTLLTDPSLIPVAVEESLRFEPPVLFLFRTVNDDTTIGATSVAKGDRIVMGIASANRDELCYANADEFRLDRTGEPEHLAFGAGPHLCLGNHLARMEAKVVVEEYLRRYEFGAIKLAPTFAFELMPHYLEYGPEHLDVVVAAPEDRA